MNTILTLLRQSIQLYRSHASLIAGYLAWLLLPFAGFILLTFIPQEEVVIIGGILLMFVEIFLWVWISIFLIRLIRDLHAGEKPNLDSIQQHTWAILAPVLVVAFIEFLTVLGGLILFIIPGIIFSIWFAFAQIAVVLDGKRGIEALAYSRSLVTGRFFSSAALILLGPILIFFLYSGIMALLILIATQGDVSAAEVFLTESAPQWYVITDTLIQIFLTTPLTIIYSVLVYQRVKQTLPKPSARDEIKEV